MLDHIGCSRSFFKILDMTLQLLYSFSPSSYQQKPTFKSFIFVFLKLSSMLIFSKFSDVKISSKIFVSKPSLVSAAETTN